MKSLSTDEILKNEELASIGGSMVTSAKICEIQLRCGCVYVSLMVPDFVFNEIKNDKEFIVESDGWWNTLADKNVVIKRMNGELIKAMKLF